jgi:peptidyl-prolyl cis-trans isomerase D
VRRRRLRSAAKQITRQRASSVAVQGRDPYDAPPFGGIAAPKVLRRQYGTRMLRGLRKASSNWLGKAVMAVVVGFLVISFAIWGIGDIFRGFGRSTFAKIGHTEIGIEQFRQLYNDRLQQISRQLGRNVTMEQARALGLDRQVVGQLVAEVALDERARALRLGITDAKIAQHITSDPAFQGTNGQFDRAKFDQLIRQAGYTEQRFIAEQRTQTLRRQLVGTVVGGAMLPKAAVAAVDRYRNEQRSIDYVLLDRSKAGDIAAPTQEQLSKYFEDRKILFRAPEYRKITILSLIPSEMAQWAEISDADLKKAYEERKSQYITPEKRTIQQIVFPTPEAAKAAAERIAKGESFDAIAKERGLSEKDISLGTLAKSAIIDKAVADAAFSLKEGESSAPVKGRFGTVIVRVTKIEPEKVPTFEEVADQLRKDLSVERAKSQVTTLYDKIEDERSVGTPLAETAEKLKIPSRTIEVDRSGRNRAGEKVANIPDEQQVLNTAFTTDPGVDAYPLRVQDGYVWIDVSNVTPAHDRTLDEVKGQVEKRWREDEIAKRLKDKAANWVEKLKGGTTLADLAKAENLKVETRTGLKRDVAAPPLSASAVQAVFQTDKNAAGSASAADPVEQIVFRVTDITVPKTDFSSAEAKQLKQQLDRGFSDDIFNEYVAHLREEVGVSINEAALRQVVTGNVSDNY